MNTMRSGFKGSHSFLQIVPYVIAHIQIDSNWVVKSRNSPFTRLYLIEEGECTVGHGGQKYTLQKGDLAVIPPHTDVSYRCQHHCKKYYIHFSAKLGTGVELFNSRKFDWVQKARDIDYVYFRHLNQMNDDAGFNIISEENQSSSDKRNIISRQSDQLHMETEGLIRCLLANFVSSKIEDEQPYDRMRVKIEQVMEYISNNLSAPLSLSDLARQVHLNQTYFSDSFHRICGMRPTVYIQQKRVEMAKLLLLSTDLQMKRISWDVGFKDIAYFCRVFKQHTGMSPGDYRKSPIKDLA
jgi:YesN/AraC family two-component response regulator